jgi:hypothetical protein
MREQLRIETKNIGVDWQLIREIRSKSLLRSMDKVSQVKDTDIILLREPEEPEVEAKGEPICRRQP